MFEGVHSFVFAGQTHARQVGFLHGQRRGVVHLAGQPHEGTVLAQPAAQSGRVLVQKRSQSGGGRSGVRHFARIGVYRATLHAAGQNLAVANVNIAAPRLDQFGVRVLTFGHGFEIGAENKLHVEGPAPQDDPQPGE